MIVSFSIENWMSFKNPVSFSMISTRERQHGERITKIDKYQMRILPIAALYGGNASGKTNFFKALNFVKNLVVKGTQPDSMIAVEPFRLDDLSMEKPSHFKVELLVDDTVYEFSFTITRKAVIKEKLVKITSTSEKVLYNRMNNKPNFDKSLNKDEFLHFAFRGTRNNQLFLTNSVSQNIDTFRPVYNWFKNNLILIAPDSRFGPFEYFIDEKHPLYNTMSKILPQLDTGIIHLGGEEVPFDNIPLSDQLKTRLLEEIEEGKSIRIGINNDERYIVSRIGDDLIARKLISLHKKLDGSEIKFDFSQESDGSKRIIDLLPAFLDIAESNSRKVYVIDEIDRSLHTLLTRQLIETYLDNCFSDSRSQLLITTHDILLMDQRLLRRDEMWVTERDINGVSNLFSFSEFKDVRYDKDIRKSYLLGRMGGIPRILFNA